MIRNYKIIDIIRKPNYCKDSTDYNNILTYTINYYYF